MSSPTSATGSATNNNTRLTTSQKKANHIASEAKRREMIREGFDSLASLVPGMEGQGRSEAVVLQATVQFLQEQLEEREELRREAEGRGLRLGEVEGVFGGGGGQGSGRVLGSGRRGSRVVVEEENYVEGEEVMGGKQGQERRSV